MDPTACLQRLLQAMIDQDADETADACEELASWLRKGGFMPYPETARLAILSVVQPKHEPG